MKKISLTGFLVLAQEYQGGFLYHVLTQSQFLCKNQSHDSSPELNMFASGLQKAIRNGIKSGDVSSELSKKCA